MDILSPLALDGGNIGINLVTVQVSFKRGLGEKAGEKEAKTQGYKCPKDGSQVLLFSAILITKCFSVKTTRIQLRWMKGDQKEQTFSCELKTREGCQAHHDDDS